MQDINQIKEKHIIDKFPAAQDFSAKKTGGGKIKLSDYRHKKHLLLVFNRGFL